MAREYATLELAAEVKSKDGAPHKSLVVMRPTAADMTVIADEPKLSVRFGKFAERCCRLTNGAKPPKYLEFNPRDLDASDAGEIMAVMASLNQIPDPEEIQGDGINEPIVYSLKHPVFLERNEDGSPKRDGAKISQIEFAARKVGDLSAVLDADGATGEFPAFVQTFGIPLGTKLPLTDSMIAAFDFEDYVAIRTRIMGKLVMSRGRWKKAST